MTGPDRDEIAAAVDVLSAGGLVAFPTETVYGLGADAANVDAVRGVFAVKGRPGDHPLIVHLGSSEGLEHWAAEIPGAARRLADRFWPGPLTLLLARHPRVPDAVTGGRDTVGLRVPDHPVALALLSAFADRRDGDAGVAAPSANRFGKVSPTTAAHVRADLGSEVDLILDGGPCRVGVESTIVDLTGDRPEVLRLGGVGLEELGEVLGVAPSLVRSVEPPDRGVGRGGTRAPGMSASHYAPSATLVVAATAGDHDLADRVVQAVERLGSGGARVAVLAPSVVDDLPVGTLELEPAGDARNYARVLYDRLRQADRLGAAAIVAVAPPPGGLGDAVRDRLDRAAH